MILGVFGRNCKPGAIQTKPAGAGYLLAEAVFNGCRSRTRVLLVTGVG